MADNVAITAGSGTTIATDDVGAGVQVQRVKTTWGPDGTANDADVASGKALPVQLRDSDGTDVAVSGKLGSLTETAPATDTASSGINGRLQRIAQRITTLVTAVGTHVFGAGTAAAAQRVTLASDDPAVATIGATSGSAVITDASGTVQQYLRGLIKQWIAGTLVLGTGSNVIGQVTSAFATVTAQVTRPSDTNAYAAEDALANSTSAPTSGGFTLTGCARASGGAGVITDAVIGMSTAAGTSLQGEVWLFDTSATAINDNAAFSISDADRDKLVGIIPFTTNQSGSLNASAHVTGLNMGFTCVGSADLRFLVKVKNAYTPASAEVFTVRVKIQQVN